MSDRDVLAPFSSNSMPESRSSNGGQVPVRDVLNYSPPKGPTSQSHEGPGLGGTNHGPCGGQQGRH